MQMSIKETKGQRYFKVVNYVLLSIITLFTLYPLIHVLFASFSSDAALQAHKGILYKPLGFTLDAYKMVINDDRIISGYLNTLFILFFGLIINMVLTTIAAYALSRKSFKYSGAIMLYIVFTMYFSGGMIPMYLLVKQLGLIDSLWAVILPSAISSFNLIILRTNFMQIPDSLVESVTLDGAGHFTILWHIVIPLSKAGLAVVFLYYAVNHWNAWFNASLYLHDKTKYPLQLVLRDILISNDTSNMTAGETDVQVAESLKHAVIVVVTIPILAVYPFIQKYFAEGVMIGAVKG